MKTKLALSYNQKIDRRDYDGKDHMTVTLSVLRNESKEDRFPRWRNCGHFSENLPQYEDMIVSAYTKTEDEWASYGWAIAYQKWQTELRDAELMVKTLKAIDRAMTKMQEQEGTAQTFGQFVNRFARAIGADKLIQWTSTNSSYDEASYNTWKLADIPWFVDNKIREFQHPQTEESAVA